jgi:hypothetical protein
VRHIFSKLEGTCAFAEAVYVGFLEVYDNLGVLKVSPSVINLSNDSSVLDTDLTYEKSLVLTSLLEATFF